MNTLCAAFVLCAIACISRSYSAATNVAQWTFEKEVNDQVPTLLVKLKDESAVSTGKRKRSRNTGIQFTVTKGAEFQELRFITPDTCQWMAEDSQSVDDVRHSEVLFKDNHGGEPTPQKMEDLAALFSRCMLQIKQHDKYWSCASASSSGSKSMDVSEACKRATKATGVSPRSSPPKKKIRPTTNWKLVRDEENRDALKLSKPGDGGFSFTIESSKGGFHLLNPAPGIQKLQGCGRYTFKDSVGWSSARRFSKVYQDNRLDMKVEWSAKRDDVMVKHLFPFLHAMEKLFDSSESIALLQKQFNECRIQVVTGGFWHHKYYTCQTKDPQGDSEPLDATTACEAAKKKEKGNAARVAYDDYDDVFVDRARLEREEEELKALRWLARRMKH